MFGKKPNYRSLYQAIIGSQSKCQWCLATYDEIEHLVHLLEPPPLLCPTCRSKLNYNPIVIRLDSLIGFSFYEYDYEFSRLLIQYKELRDIQCSPLFFQRDKRWLAKIMRDYDSVLIPSHFDKIKMRGFDHNDEIFRWLGCPVHALEKCHNIQQASLHKDERQKIEFKLKPTHRLGLKKILLCDDVITTGSSIKAAYKELKPHYQVVGFVSCAYNSLLLNQVETSPLNDKTIKKVKKQWRDNNV